MSEPASYFQDLAASPLLQRAAAAGALAGLACAVLSPYVVLRRMAFVGDGMAHAAFGGLGLGLFLIAGSSGDDLLVQAVTVAFCLLLALAVGKASRRRAQSRIAEDSAIGIAFAVSMALGALLISLRQRRDPLYAPSWEGYLFGNLLTIGPVQVWIMLSLAVALLLILALLHKELMFYSYDEGLAEVSGLPVAWLHYLFLLLLVLTVVVSSRVVGIVLVSASLILPGLVALALCQRLALALVLAALIGIASFQLGLYFSYAWKVPPGSAIVLSQFFFLLVAYAVKRLRLV